MMTVPHLWIKVALYVIKIIIFGKIPKYGENQHFCLKKKKIQKKWSLSRSWEKKKSLHFPRGATIHCQAAATAFDGQNQGVPVVVCEVGAPEHPLLRDASLSPEEHVQPLPGESQSQEQTAVFCVIPRSSSADI